VLVLLLIQTDWARPHPHKESDVKAVGRLPSFGESLFMSIRWSKAKVIRRQEEFNLTVDIISPLNL
jgi:hypothetical protein